MTIDISNLTEQELMDLSRKIRQKEDELDNIPFDRFFQSEDFKLLYQINSRRMQEKKIEITITVPVLVSVDAFKEGKTRIDVIAEDKRSLVRDTMIDALSQKPVVQEMQKDALEAEKLFDEKMSEFIKKYNLDPALALMRITNKMSRIHL